MCQKRMGFAELALDGDRCSVVALRATVGCANVTARTIGLGQITTPNETNLALYWKDGSAF
jgi:hypothetical protein